MTHGTPESASLVVAAHNSREEDADFVCTGTDDQVEINRAIDSLPAEGGVLRLSEGTFNISDSIHISRCVELSGAGPSTVLKAMGSKENTIVIHASGKSDLLIRDLRIAGDGDQNGGSMYGIYFERVKDSKILNIWIEGLQGPEILLQSCSGNTITGTTIRGNGLSAIHLASSDGHIINGNVIKDNEEGVVLSSSDGNTTSNNTVHDNRTNGIVMSSSSGNVISGNTIGDNGMNGLVLSSLSEDNVVSGNTLLRNENGVVVSSSSDGNTVSGNVIGGNRMRGIVLYSSGDNVVSVNIIKGNSQAEHDEYDGIRITNNSDFNNFQGNSIRRGESQNQQRYGIHVESPDCEGNYIKNNDLHRAGATSDISDSGTSTIVQNNRLTGGWE